MIASDHPLFVDLGAIETGDPDWSLITAIAALKDIYRSLDEHLTRTTATLALPCRQDNRHLSPHGASPCRICCHESVFLTPLEWFAVVDYMQAQFSPEQLLAAITAAHAIYRKNQVAIDACSAPPPPGEKDHWLIARDLKFSCPLLSASGCSIYPVREILGRLFGASFNDQHGIYGCQLSGAFFSANPDATLVSAERWAKRLTALPLTASRQVYPVLFPADLPAEPLKSETVIYRA